MANSFWINLAGWSGAILLLSAYLLISARKLTGDSFLYQFLNLVGSLLLLLNAFYFGAYPSVGVNSIWIGIAFFAIIKNKSRNQKEE